MYRITNGVRGEGIVEYGPVAAKAEKLQIHKGNVLDFLYEGGGGRIVEYDPMAAKAEKVEIHEGNV